MLLSRRCLFNSLVGVKVTLLLLLYVSWTYLPLSFQGSKRSPVVYQISTCYGTLLQLFPDVLRSEFPTETFDRLCKNATWQSAGAKKSYVYTGYIDDRPARDVDRLSLPVARIFAVFPRKDTVVGQWRCLFWYDKPLLDFPVEVVVVRWTDLNEFDPNSEIANVMLICPIPMFTQSTNSTSQNQNSNCQMSANCSQLYRTPFAVSVIPASCSKPTNLVCLVDLPARRKQMDQTRLQHKSKNQRSQFAICVPPIFGKESSLAQDFVEFIQVNRIFGASRFFFYIESESPSLWSCLHRYASKFRNRHDLVHVDWVSWKLSSELSTLLTYHGQFITINECLYRLMYLTDFVVSQDLDEFIVPMKADNWTSVIANNNCHNWGNLNSVASYTFRHRYLQTSWSQLTSPNTTILARGYSDLVKRKFRTLLHYTGDRNLMTWRERSKVMARPERVFLWHVHEMLDSSLVYSRTDINCLVNSEDAELYHYRQSASPINNEETVPATRVINQFGPTIMKLLKKGVEICLR